MQTIAPAGTLTNIIDCDTGCVFDVCKHSAQTPRTTRACKHNSHQMTKPNEASKRRTLRQLAKKHKQRAQADVAGRGRKQKAQAESASRGRKQKRAQAESASTGRKQRAQTKSASFATMTLNCRNARPAHMAPTHATYTCGIVGGRRTQCTNTADQHMFAFISLSLSLPAFVCQCAVLPSIPLRRKNARQVVV